MAPLVEEFFICWSCICPCFHSRVKDGSEAHVLGRDSSLDSSNSLELRSPYGSPYRIPQSPSRVPASPSRVPASPSRVPASPSRFSLSPHTSAIGPLNLTLSQIMKLTNNFSPSLVIGEGIFGTVYRAELPDGQIIAIKRARKEHFGTLKAEFSNEVSLLTKIEHRNLVRLLGYTDSENERLIITEYVSNGNLREHLDGQHGRILDFSQRLEIAIDVAHGLTYLHLYAEKTIIHRDVKSSNILLTENFRAKVADFGFARTGSTEPDQSHVETKVKGTAGYVDPEYLRTYHLTPKSDVYSFGILLLEILSARRPVELRRNAQERITVRWAFTKHCESREREILDPSMEERVEESVLKKIFNLTFQCVAPSRHERPTMKGVVEELWVIRKDYARSRGAMSSS